MTMLRHLIGTMNDLNYVVPQLIENAVSAYLTTCPPSTAPPLRKCSCLLGQVLLQSDSTADNPYYGCGSLIKNVGDRNIRNRIENQLSPT